MMDAVQQPLRLLALSLAPLTLSLGLNCDAQAGDSSQRSRLLVTSGASTIEGAAGGGIVPMAVIAGYGAQEEQGGAAFVSGVQTGDYNLQVAGVSWGWRNRLELSFAAQQLGHQALTDALQLPDNRIRQRILGLKLRLAGDLIYTSLPQISFGAQYKKNRDFFVPSAVGAQSDSGTDLNLSATKLLLAGAWGRNLLLNANLRYTKANQTGLVGFGGDRTAHGQLMSEASVAVLLNSHWLVGTEYRHKPNNLSALREDDWQTLFVGWFPSKRLALVAGYVDLGEVATFKEQTGWYLSLQGSF